MNKNKLFAIAVVSLSLFSVQPNFGMMSSMAKPFCCVWNTLRNQNPYVQCAIGAGGVAATAYGAYYAYQAGQKKIVEVTEKLKVKSEDVLVDLILLFVKPNGNCTPEELQDKAKLYAFMNDVSASSESQFDLNKIITQACKNPLLQGFIETLNTVGFVVKNDEIGKDEHKRWISLFTALPIPDVSVDYFQQKIVDRIDENKKNKTDIGHAQQRILQKLKNKIEGMDVPTFESHFIPAKIRNVFLVNQSELVSLMRKKIVDNLVESGNSY